MNIHHPSRNKKTLTPKSIHLLSTKIRPPSDRIFPPNKKKRGSLKSLCHGRTHVGHSNSRQTFGFGIRLGRLRKVKGLPVILDVKNSRRKAWDFYWVVFRNQIKINENHKKQSKTPTENQDGTQRKNSPRNGLKSGAFHHLPTKPS